MNQGFIAQISQSTINLVTAHSAVTNQIGFNLFRGISVCLVVWEGYRIAFGMQPANRIAGLLVSIAIIYSALVFYSVPFPGVGKNLTQIVTDAGADIAQEIDTANEENAGQAMSNAMGDAAGDNWSIVTNPGATIRYYIFFFAVAAMQVAMLGIIAYGFIAVGVIVLVGPIMIPFFLVPGFDWLATSWMRALIEYSFYPVIGSAFVYVYSSIWLNFFSQFNGPVDSQMIAAGLTQVVIYSFSCVFGILKVPQLTSSIFSGHSGLSAMPSFGWWR